MPTSCELTHASTGYPQWGRGLGGWVDHGDQEAAFGVWCDVPAGSLRFAFFFSGFGGLPIFGVGASLSMRFVRHLSASESVHGVKEAIADSGQADPDLQVEVLDMAAEDDIVFVHWRAAGTHEGQYKVVKHVRDVEPTGEEGIVSGILLYRIEGEVRRKLELSQPPRVRARSRQGRGTRRRLLDCGIV
jgi:hypothetical protein